MAKKKPAHSKSKPSKSPQESVEEDVACDANVSHDVNSASGNFSVLNATLDTLPQAMSQQEHQGEGHVYKYSLRTAPRIRPEDVEATMAVARDGLFTLLQTAKSLNVDPKIKAKAGSSLVDVLRFFVSSWNERSNQATLNPNFPVLREENDGFKARCKELYPRPARHDQLGKAVQSFVFDLWFKLSAREIMSAEIAVYGQAIPIVSSNGKPMPERSFKAFDRWAAKVKCLAGFAEHSPGSLQTLVWYAQAEHFESYWKMVFMPIAKRKHNDAVNNPAMTAPNWREIANHSWRGVIVKRAKKALADRIMIFKGTKFEGGFIY